MKATMASVCALLALTVGCSAEDRALNRVESAQADVTECKSVGGDCKVAEHELAMAVATAQEAGATEDQIVGAMKLEDD